MKWGPPLGVLLLICVLTLWSCGGSGVENAGVERSAPRVERLAPAPSPAKLEADVREAVKDYYEAVDRQDWDYTYDNLASQTQQMFTREEWTRKNQWFADNYPQELRFMDIKAEVSPSALVADVRVDRTFKDGLSLSRATQFIYEEGSWKHFFSQEERDLFMPDASFEEFVKAKKYSSSESSTNTSASH